MKVWEKRFRELPSDSTIEFTSSLREDFFLYPYDIKGSQAHVKMLCQGGYISSEEEKTLLKGLKKVKKELDEGIFPFQKDEDIHMAIERRLKELVGEVADKLHTARSRNDQVVLDEKMFLKEKITAIIERIESFQETVLRKAEENIEVIPEIMIPLVGHINEIRYLKQFIKETADKMIEESGVDLKYTIGTMIEVPRAAITADEIAKEAVENVSAIIKKFSGKDISNYDIHVQFLQTYDGVEGDSASISIATAIMSSLVDIPIKQNIAMSGSLSIRGEVLPVGGINAKIVAAKKAGLDAVIIPKMNETDVYVKGIKIIPVDDLSEVIRNVFDFKKSDKKMISRVRKVIK